MRRIATVIAAAAAIVLVTAMSVHAADDDWFWEKAYELGYEPVPDQPYDPEVVTLETPWVGYFKNEDGSCDLLGVRPSPSDPRIAAQAEYEEFDHVVVDIYGTEAWKVTAKLADPTKTSFKLTEGWKLDPASPQWAYWYAKYKPVC